MRILPLACTLLAASFWTLADAANALTEGDKAPAFAAKSLTGNGNLSLAKYRGKVVYVDFWASWCGPCNKSLPLLAELRKEFPRDQFEVLAINVDKDLDKARALLSKHDIQYPSVSDPQGQLPETFGLKTMPTSYLIDRKGVIRHVHKGFRPTDMDGIRARVKGLVGGKK